MELTTLSTRRAALVVGAVLSTIGSPSSRLAQAAPTSTLPLLGLGSCCDDYDAALATVLEGLRLGYRLVDTAAHYESEPAVGAAISEACRRGIIGSAREVRTVTKIWFDDMGYEPALASAMRSMANLQVDCLDVLLIHFPGSVDAVQSPTRNRKLRADTWRACETLLRDGRARSIGFSNYTPRHLREALASGSTTPHVLQTELHPRLQQRELIEYARDQLKVPTIMAHCPLAHGSSQLLQDSTLVRIAEARGNDCTPAMLCLRWSIDSGFVPVPKASSTARLEQNLRVASSMSPLSAAERAAIDALDVGDRVSFDPRLIA